MVLRHSDGLITVLTWSYITVMSWSRCWHGPTSYWWVDHCAVMVLPHIDELITVLMVLHHSDELITVPMVLHHSDELITVLHCPSIIVMSWSPWVRWRVHHENNHLDNPKIWYANLVNLILNLSFLLSWAPGDKIYHWPAMDSLHKGPLVRKTCLCHSALTAPGSQCEKPVISWHSWTHYGLVAPYAT